MSSYHLSIVKRPTHVHAKVVGERTPENALKFFREAHAACDEHAADAVLLEMNFGGPSLPVEHVYRVISQRSAEALKLRKIAYVEGLAEEVNARFAETVAVNRGVNVRLFPDVAAAEAWLAA